MKKTYPFAIVLVVSAVALYCSEASAQSFMSQPGCGSCQGGAVISGPVFNQPMAVQAYPSYSAPLQYSAPMRCPPTTYQYSTPYGRYYDPGPYSDCVRTCYSKYWNDDALLYACVTACAPPTMGYTTSTYRSTSQPTTCRPRCRIFSRRRGR